MKATLLYRDNRIVAEGCFADMVVWQVPSPVPASGHLYKYRLAYVVGGVCALRYDNEAGKGDHKHVGADEFPYAFTTPRQLLIDFWADVARLRGDEHEYSDH